MHQPLFVLFYNISNQIPSSTITFKVIILYIYTMPHLIVVGSYAPLCPIVIDFLHQIKGGVGILRHITVRVGLGDQIAVAVVDINGTVAKRVDLLRDQIPTIVLIQRDLVGVHAVEGIHTVEVGGNELVIFIVGKYGLRAQRIDGLYNVSIAIIDIPCGIAVAVLDLHDAVCGIIGKELRIAAAVFHTGNPIQGVIGIGHGAGSIRHGGEVAIGIVGIAGHNALGIGLALDIACQVIGKFGIVLASFDILLSTIHDSGSAADVAPMTTSSKNAPSLYSSPDSVDL